MEESDAEPGSYDFISMTDVLEILSTAALSAGRARVSEAGGHMLITFPDIGSLDRAICA